MQPLQTSGGVAVGGWRLDRQAISSAIEELQIERPVVIKFTSTNVRLYGAHRCYGGKHTITIDERLPVVKVSETLWHELAHARQAEVYARSSGEDMGLFYRRVYLPYGASGKSYQTNPFEEQARGVAADHSGVMLVQPAERGW